MHLNRLTKTINGELVKKTESEQTTTYTYDAFGNLTEQVGGSFLWNVIKSP